MNDPYLLVGDTDGGEIFNILSMHINLFQSHYQSDILASIGEVDCDTLKVIICVNCHSYIVYKK